LLSNVTRYLHAGRIKGQTHGNMTLVDRLSGALAGPHVGNGEVLVKV
jgi:hypothetical protein